MRVSMCLFLRVRVLHFSSSHAGCSPHSYCCCSVYGPQRWPTEMAHRGIVVAVCMAPHPLMKGMQFIHVPCVSL